MKAIHIAETYMTETGELTGIFEGGTGILELEHDLKNGSVTGRYTYHSDDYVAELDGKVERLIMRYRFHWFDRDIRGMGFHLISENANWLQGVWLSTDDLDSLPLEAVFSHGTRNWYKRIE